MAIEQEYTGFVPANNPLDWGKLTSGLVKTIQGIGAEREAQRQALDQLQSDNAKILQNTELGKSQTFNQLILAGSNDGREAMMEWNRQLKDGQLKPVEYRNKINSLMDSWSTFANVAKSYDQQMQAALKRQQDGDASAFETFNNEVLANFGDLKNKQGKVDRESGVYMIGQLNPDGLFDPTTVRDPRALAKPGNMMDNRIKLQEIVADSTKSWEGWINEVGATTTAGKLANPAVVKARTQLAKSIAPNERAMASVLTDNTDDEYDFYINQGQFESKLQEKIELQNEVNRNLGKAPLSGAELDKFKQAIAERLIFVSPDDQGVNQPRLTERQKDAAMATIYDAIDATLDKKITQDELIRSGGGSGGGGGSKQKEEKQTSGIPGKVYSAWNNVESLGAAESERIMNQASGGKYSFKWEQGGLNVYKPDSRGQLVKQNSTPITNPQYLSDYFGYNPDKWTSEGKKGLQASTSKSASYTSAQEANIKATLKANPGATRQQAIEALGY